MSALADGIRAFSLVLLSIGLLAVFGPLDLWWNASWSLTAVYAHWWRNIAGGLFLIALALLLRRTVL